MDGEGTTVLVRPNPTTLRLQEMLSRLQRLPFTGILRVQDQQRMEWQLCFHSGVLIWAAGGLGPQARWWRHLYHTSPEVALQGAGETEGFAQSSSCRILLSLYQQGQVDRDAVIQIVQGLLAEVLFDVMQAQERGRLWYGRESWEDRMLPQARILLDLLQSDPSQVQPVFQPLPQATEVWQRWQQAGLTAVSPAYAPVLRQAQQFRERVKPQVYTKLKPLLTGRLTLRGVALLLNQDLVQLSRALLAHQIQGQIAFVSPDQEETPHLLATAKLRNRIDPPQPTQPPHPRGSLIACIDDSQQICQMLGHISTQAGHRFIAIQDPVKAVPEMVRCQPDFIFLDLEMPMTSGYEICGQIRKISALKEIPVIILTSHDGVIDRVRARWVGATDFVSKPIETERILTVIQKYLPQGRADGASA